MGELSLGAALRAGRNNALAPLLLGFEWVQRALPRGGLCQFLLDPFCNSQTLKQEWSYAT